MNREKRIINRLIFGDRINTIVANMSNSPAGNGKLTEYKDKNDSWILEQMNNGIVRRSIQTPKDSHGDVRFTQDFSNKIIEK